MNSILLSDVGAIEANVERSGYEVNRRPRTEVNEGDDVVYYIVGNVF